MHSENRKGKRVKSGRSTVKTLRKGTYDLEYIFERLYDAKRAEDVVQETIDRYQRACEYLTLYAGTIGLDADIRHIDVDFARGFVSWLRTEKVKFDGHKFKLDKHKTKGLSARSVNDYIKTVRTFFRFAVKEGYTDENPFQDISLINAPENPVNILTPDEMRSLLKTMDQRLYVEFRDYVAVTCLIDSMMRVGEVMSIKEQNIDFGSKMLVLEGKDVKNRKGRFVPLEDDTLRLLRELIRENEDFDSDYVFLANYGEKMTTNNFRQRLNTYAERAGIKKRVHPHLIRHTGATMFLEDGGDIRHLQMILGHKDLRMVMRYTHLSKKALTEEHSKHSPLLQIKENSNKKRKTRRR
ncbi:tyrosine-type recombinase/integrase [Bacillus sp. FSL K6-3846]|uniref:tyrosine-type recombinase/integrase n=1 Tax=Bacillus TaxID=1386 RepID=UPI002852F98A|nr:tyrosine-type recombinase/integrase [Bacillus sonorensis]MDR4959667.1 tyrosine-type recombinase/integrase [Bacillus sonorensis]